MPRRLRSRRRRRGSSSRYLRHLPQRAAENGRPGPGWSGRRRRARARRGVGEGHQESPGQHDAPGGKPPARRGDPGGLRRRAGEHARPRRGGPAAPRTHPSPPVQPRGIRQRRPRPAGAGDRRRCAAAAGRLELRLRQHRRHPWNLAVADGALRRRGRAHQRAGRGRPVHRPELAAVPRQLRSPAARAHHRAADRHPRRHRVSAPLPAGRGIRHQAAAVEDQRRLRARAPDGARYRGQHRRPASAAGAGGRPQRLPDERPQLGGGGNRARIRAFGPVPR